jgi:uncharacterized protein (DUF1800 family)
MLSIRTAIATNRFGLGARPGDAAAVGNDAEAWLLRQIEPAGPAAAPPERPASAETIVELTELQLARQALRQRLTGEVSDVEQAALREYGQFVTERYRSQATAAFRRAIETEQPFHERLVGFWANHFAVSADKQPVRAIAGLYRDEAIRPHVAGNFRDLLTAAIRHPAMLLYLDNVASIGPNSVLGLRANRNRRAGLNENLAREILELHTVGVTGGYTQNDVIEFAKTLTGWSIAGQGPGANRMSRLAPTDAGTEGRSPGRFAFRDAIHEPGAKTILGRTIPEGGADETETVLAFLAGLPATAHFLATKLARHFVADAPPAQLIEHLAQTYLDHDGELAPVYTALVRARESWDEPLAKFKTPAEFIVSIYRTIGAGPSNDPFVSVATQLGQRPFTPGSPAGWPDQAAQWNGGDALLKRVEWATRVGRIVGDRVDAVERLDEVLGASASDSTRQAVAHAESGAQAMALLLSSPEFQRR